MHDENLAKVVYALCCNEVVMVPADGLSATCRAIAAGSSTRRFRFAVGC